MALRLDLTLRQALLVTFLLCTLCACAAAGKPAEPAKVNASPGRLSGRVLDPEGKPVEGAVVSLMSRRLGQSLMALSGADGAYAFSEVPPSTDWMLHAEDVSHGTPEDRRVRVAAGASLTYDVKMEPPPELRRFSRDANGEIRRGRGAPQVPDGWTEMSGDDLFTFFLPPGFAEVAGREKDPWVKDFEGPGLYVAYRFGYTFGPFSCVDMERCRERMAVVGGRAAQLLTYEEPKPPDELKYFVGVFVPDTGNGDATLSFWAYCKGRGEVETARQIIKSIRFP